MATGSRTRLYDIRCGGLYRVSARRRGVNIEAASAQAGPQEQEPGRGATARVPHFYRALRPLSAGRRRVCVYRFETGTGRAIPDADPGFAPGVRAVLKVRVYGDPADRDSGPRRP